MIIVPGTTSFITHVFIQDSTVTTGAGKTALAFGDITAYYVRSGDVLTALTMVDITTLGTWDADVTSDKLGLKKLHDTNAPGMYEVHFPNNLLAAGADFCSILLRATGAAPCPIRIQLGNVPANVQVMATDALTAAALKTDALVELALAGLVYDWDGITGEPDRCSLNALRFLRNKWSITGTTLTVTKEDDTTAAWTSALSTDAAAAPVVGSDPAGP